jgi:hypothetical protein
MSERGGTLSRRIPDMTTALYEPPLNHVVAALLLLVGAAAAVRGGRRLAAGLRRAVALDVVRGIRGCVVALAATAFASGVLLAETGLIVLGTVFLGEELYETGVLAAIIRSGEPRPEPQE